ncbi:MAG: hypothetical protein R2746_14175 [Acidimicrobiales bacterium]
MESPEKTAARARAKRNRLALRVGIAVVAALVVGGVVLAVRSDDRGPAETGTPGVRDEDRTIDTSPFELAGPDVTAPTTIPGDPGSASEPTLPPDTLPPATTTTTIVIPDVVDDPQCRMAKAVIEGLRFITGPDGTAPANLAAGAAKYREAADIALNSGLPGTAPVALLTAQIAVDLPGARTPAEVEAIYQRLSAPTDPAIIPVAQAFAAHLREACPDLIRVEP